MNCKKKDCKAHAMRSNDFCFSHNPEVKEKHLQATSKGGSVGKVGEVKLEPLQIDTPDGVVSLLSDTINRIRTTHEDGRMGIKTANCIGYLAGQLIKAIEVANLSSRLEIVERVILERKSITKKR